MAKRVLAIGIEPGVADYSTFPQLTPELVRNYIETQLLRLRGLGYEVTSCLIDLDAAAEAAVTAALRDESFDCIVIGAGPARAEAAPAAVREGAQPRPPPGAQCGDLLQHHARRHRRGRAALDRALTRRWPACAPHPARSELPPRRAPRRHHGASRWRRWLFFWPESTSGAMTQLTTGEVEHASRSSHWKFWDRCVSDGCDGNAGA
ncbi:hypothetical protein ACVWW6_002029 [Bradyrhizobium sp. USDA 3311]